MGQRLPESRGSLCTRRSYERWGQGLMFSEDERGRCLVSLGRAEPELALVIALARENPGPFGPGEVGIADLGRLDAGKFGSLCMHHKVGPLVFDSLKRNSVLPRSFREEACAFLEDEAVRPWVIHHSRLRHLQEEIEECLDGAEVPFIWIRGLRFAERHYRNPSVRSSADLDLLVPEAHFESVSKLMLEAGYRFAECDSRRRARSMYMGQVELIAPRFGLGVDLNFGFGGNGGIGRVGQDMKGVWRRARPIEGMRYGLACEDELCELIRHVVHGHSFAEGLIRACADVRQFFGNGEPAVDWNCLDRLSRYVECGRASAFFVDFYERYYRMSGEEPSLPSRFGDDWCLTRNDTKRFHDTIVIPLLQPKEGLYHEARREMLSLSSAVWTLDRIGGLLRILRIIAWPTCEERVLPGSVSLADRPVLLRLEHYGVVMPVECWALVHALWYGRFAVLGRWLREACAFRR